MSEGGGFPESSRSQDHQHNPTTTTIDYDNSGFECNICLDSPQDPVVTLCGHLFCWPCLHRWLQQRHAVSSKCPLCRGSIKEEEVVPLYGRGKNASDPRSRHVVPNRPTARRRQEETVSLPENYDDLNVIGREPSAVFSLSIEVVIDDDFLSRFKTRLLLFMGAFTIICLVFGLV